MGCATSLGLDIVLTDALLPSLKSCKYLTLSQVKLLLESLKKRSRRSVTAHPDQVHAVLSNFTNDSAELCKVFSMKIGYLNEKFVNIYYLVSALIVHSYASWESKVRCNIYLVLFNLYVNFETLSIGIEEMKLLAQSVVKGVYLSTGRKLPHNRIFCELAIEVFNKVNVRRDMRVDLDE